MKPKITDNELLRHHAAGKTVRQICQEHGNITRIAVYKRLQNLGLTPNSPYSNRLPQDDNKLQARVLLMINEIVDQGGCRRVEQAVEEVYLDVVAI